MEKAPTRLGLEIAPQMGSVGLQPFETRNIRLSSVLLTFGFELMLDTQPVAVVIDFETEKRAVSFFHKSFLPETSHIKKQLPTLSAFMLEMWWSDPSAFIVEGYQDALLKMRRVFECREWLIGVIKGRHGAANDGRWQKNSVFTKSLHAASVIRASDFPLIAFDHGTFIFKSGAAGIAGLIDAVENTDQSLRSNTEEDSCVDWMLWALKYHDWLKSMVRDPNNIPLIEKRDGERALRISTQMPKTLRREFTRRF